MKIYAQDFQSFLKWTNFILKSFILTRCSAPMEVIRIIFYLETKSWRKLINYIYNLFYRLLINLKEYKNHAGDVTFWYMLIIYSKCPYHPSRFCFFHFKKILFDFLSVFKEDFKCEKSWALRICTWIITSIIYLNNMSKNGALHIDYVLE